MKTTEYTEKIYRLSSLRAPLKTGRGNLNYKGFQSGIAASPTAPRNDILSFERKCYAKAEVSHNRPRLAELRKKRSARDSCG